MPNSKASSGPGEPVGERHTEPTVGRAADMIRRASGPEPCPVAIILGSGLGGLADKIESPVAIDFADIPGFGTSTASGHRGQLIVGEIESVRVVAMAGRFHRYEGWSNDDVAFPVAVMNSLGADRLIVSNAAGGVRAGLSVGDIVVLSDHVNFMTGVFSFNASSADGMSTRRSSASPASPGETVYDREMSAIAMRVARRADFTATPGTYLATFGPNYETRAEYRMMRRLGADVVGMSTVPEVIAAKHLGMRVLGLSMVSNVANPDAAVVADHAEVLDAGRAAEVKMEAIVRGVLRSV